MAFLQTHLVRVYAPVPELEFVKLHRGYAAEGGTENAVVTLGGLRCPADKQIDVSLVKKNI